MERFRKFYGSIKSVFMTVFKFFISFAGETIKVSPGLWFVVPKPQIRLISRALDVVHYVNLSVPQVQVVFNHIRAACETDEVHKFSTDSLEWTIQGRTRDAGDRHIKVSIRDGLTRHTQWVNCHDAIRASNKFSDWLRRLSHEGRPGRKDGTSGARSGFG